LEKKFFFQELLPITSFNPLQFHLFVSPYYTTTVITAESMLSSFAAVFRGVFRVELLKIKKQLHPT